MRSASHSPAFPKCCYKVMEPSRAETKSLCALMVAPVDCEVSRSADSHERSARTSDVLRLEETMVKPVYVLPIAVLLLTWAGTQRKVGAEQVWMGVISDSTCRADHGGGEVDPKECTQKCVRNGDQYVLVTDRGATTLAIKNQDFGTLFENAGDTVKVTGELSGGAVVISKIEKSR